MRTDQWSDERKETVRQMWMDGWSATAIALELGDVTDSAVRNIVDRMGLERRHKRIRATVSTAWTDERVEALKALAADGLSGSQIAYELGGVTRNAVIGKLCRLGIRGGNGRPRQTATAPQPRRPRGNNPTGYSGKIRKHDPGVEALPPEPDFTIPIEQRRSLVELGPHHCRWPCGDPASPDFFFCGGQSIGDPIPYCTYHARIAYQPRTPRKPYVQEAR